MRTLLLLGVLLLCGIGSAEAQTPPVIDTAVRSERMVMRLKAGQVAKARSTQHFKVSDTVGVAAFANGRKLWDANAGGSRLDLAGFGAYVVVTFNRAGVMEVKAVALRKMRLVVFMEWSA